MNSWIYRIRPGSNRQCGRIDQPRPYESVVYMLELFRELSGYLATVVEAAAAVIIAYGAVEAGIRVLKLLITRENMQFSKEDIRLNLGQWLTLALEFELAADILRTAVAPSWNDIGQLAAIIVIRTTLNYFLQKELEKAEARRGSAVSTACPS